MLDLDSLLNLFNIVENSLLFSVGEMAVVGYISSVILENYNINKKFFVKPNYEVKFPPELIDIHQEIATDRINNLIMGEEIAKFEEKLKNRFNISNLKIFYHNLKDLNVKKINLRIKSGTLGWYQSDKNTIYLYDNEHIDYSLDHELSHVASSYYSKNDNMVFSGFSQVNTKSNKSIGDGLNEGYTEVFTKRYFKQGENRQSSPYIFLEEIAILLEKIVGQEKIESLYLHADLYGLIEELKKYDEDINIKNFIVNVDIMHNFLCSQKNTPVYIRKKVISKVREVVEFLARCYLKKICYEFDSGLIDKVNISDIFSEVWHEIFWQGKKYIIYDDEEKFAMVESILLSIKEEEKDLNSKKI